jgi:hypothetical protein
MYLKDKNKNPCFKFHKCKGSYGGKGRDKKEDFYQRVEEVYKTCLSNEMKILMGDFNAEIGRK